jgi:hypothetical protein
MRQSVALVVLLLAGLSGPMQAQAAPRFELRGEFGPEYDTNPTRAERLSAAADLAPGPSALSRFVTSASGAWGFAPGVGLSLSGGVGGKRFVNADAHGEDVLVAQASGVVTMGVTDAVRLALSGAYYDAFQRGPTDRRDFRSGAPGLRLDRRFAEHGVLSVAGGYRWYAFKSDDAFSFSGPTASVRVHQSFPGDLGKGAADWDWDAMASLEWRGFAGPACERDVCTDAVGPRHTDRFWLISGEITRTSAMLVGAGAAVHVNRSNSYGESLVRGALHLRSVLPLPARFSLSARAEVVTTRYADSLPLVRDPEMGTPRISIEDESRSTLRIELARPLSANVEIGTRYTLYTSAPSTGPLDFRRQTVLLYLAVLNEN